jgi:hypothetical protein
MAVSKRNGSKYFYIQFQYNGRTYIKSSKTPDKQLALNLDAQWRKQLIEQNQLGLKSPIENTSLGLLPDSTTVNYIYAWFDLKSLPVPNWDPLEAPVFGALRAWVIR